MQTAEKRNLITKIQRELDDMLSSQTALLKKVAQVEADNINLGDADLSDALPDIHEHIDAALSATTGLQAKFKATAEDFLANNPAEEATTK